MKKEIKTIKDIRLLVDSFYGKVRKDELIGPIFNNVIGDKWPQHLEKMYLFWKQFYSNSSAIVENHFYPMPN